MNHVDALSRYTNVLMLAENTFEQTLAIRQVEDREISFLRDKLCDRRQMF